VLVCDNDPLPTGDRPAVEGAEVIVEAHALHADGQPRRVAKGQTGPGGIYGFSTPSDLAAAELAVVVHAEGRNPRRLRLDGRALAIDAAAVLYGKSSA
jgi:hypothetical protein